MKKFFLALALAGALGTRANALAVPDVIPAQGGTIRITPIYHGSLQIEYRGKVIHVDPFSAGSYKGAKKADVILITHTHPDHLDQKALERVVGDPFVHIFGPKRVTDVLNARSNPLGVANDNVKEITTIPLNNGSGYNLNTGRNTKNQKQLFHVEAVPMYNLVRGPEPGQKFHPKGQFNGYILTLGGKRIYIAGDTEATPEMKALKNIDIAFLPMNLPYTMTPQEAAAGARAFKPKIVYPYHYRYPFTKVNDNPQQFARALAGSGIEVRLRGWYDHPAAK
ncbi:MAG: MBL fold metallo-hydrolase [Armatimonadetes bacterium]|nr:MBL fold metallo-hydrolase [Armatimonadota bacterium]